MQKEKQVGKNEVFPSNAKMAQHYIKKLLDDGREHSTEEILNYVQAKADGIGVDGKRLTDETIRSAIWYGIVHRTADYEQIRKGWYLNKAAARYPLSTDAGHKHAVYFLAEQARCLTQVGCTDSEICRKAAEFLIGDDEILTAWLENRTDVKPFEDPLQDYDTEEYEGKVNDLILALCDLNALAIDGSIPQDDRVRLTDAAEIIADFYGIAA